MLLFHSQWRYRLNSLFLVSCLVCIYILSFSTPRHQSILSFKLDLGVSALTLFTLEAWVVPCCEVSQVAQWQRICLPMQELQETWFGSPCQEDPLEKEMAAHSSVLAWRLAQIEEPGGAQSLGLQRVRHDWATEHAGSSLLWDSPGPCGMITSIPGSTQ